MIDIFIPTKIKGYGEINTIREEFLDILKNDFDSLVINSFESIFFEGIKISGKEFTEDLIILCNGGFGEHYFLDFDILENQFYYSGTKIIGQNQIQSKIEKIMLDIAEITGELGSNKLLTNSKKEDIKNKIDSSFYSLSGVVFLLYSLKLESENNITELDNINQEVEYEGQAALLKETSITKSIELKAAIDKLEGKISLFIDTIKSLIK